MRCWNCGHQSSAFIRRTKLRFLMNFGRPCQITTISTKIGFQGTIHRFSPSFAAASVFTAERSGFDTQDYLPFLEWELYHETMRTFEKNERALLDANKQCELSGIRVVLDIQTYHESIVPLMKRREKSTKWTRRAEQGCTDGTPSQRG